MLQRSQILFLILYSLSVGCGMMGDDHSSTANTTSTIDNPEVSAEAVNPVASSFPGSLTLTVFPDSLSTSLVGFEMSDEERGERRPSKERQEEARAILKGAADSCAPSALRRRLKTQKLEPCYNFDQDMIYGAKSIPGQSNPNLISKEKYVGTKTGLNADGEVCLVAYSRAEVEDVMTIVDQSLSFGVAAICQLAKNNDSTALPVAGASLDVSAALEQVLNDSTKNPNQFSVTLATITRHADDVDGRPVYQTSIEVSDTKNVARKVEIAHSPASETDNRTYSGTLQISMNGGLRNGREDKHRLITIGYSRLEDRVQAELVTARVHESLVANAFDDQGRLNLDVGADFSGDALSSGFGAYTGFQNANDAIQAVSYVAFDLDPETSEGQFSFWRNPGGSYYENARGFNVTIAKDEDGMLSGCGLAGSASTNFSSGVSIRRYLRDQTESLEPKGFYHPFVNTNTHQAEITGPTDDAEGTFYTKVSTSNQQSAKWYRPALKNTDVSDVFATLKTGSLVTRQCFKQSSEGLYVLSSAQDDETAGYELVDTGIPSQLAQKAIAAPNITRAREKKVKVKN